MYKIIFCGIIFLYSLSAYTLVSLESALLGDMTEQYREKRENPLSYLFTEKKINKSDNKFYLKQLGIYKGFYYEGRNLVNSCKNSVRPTYNNAWDKVQIKRSLFATIQYLGLDLTSRALPIYAKKLGFSKNNYSNLVHNLVGNFCSTNISSISRSHIINNFLLQYDHSTFSLPSIEDNTLFTKTLRDIGNPNSNRKKEFYFTIDLFKRFCSWGGNESSARLLVPFIRNPVTYSFFVRQIANRSLSYDIEKNKSYSKFNKNTIQVLCENLICRKKTSAQFWNEVKFSIGSDSLVNDFERLYCSELRDIDYKYKEGPPKLVDYLKTMGLFDEVFSTAHLISLLTGIPDFVLRTDRFSDIRVFSKSSMDQSWNNWAKTQNKKYNKSVHYEESITIETSDRKFFFNPKIRSFGVEFEVNLGEYDRITQRVGKVKAGFRLKVPRKLLKWAIENYTENSAKEFIKMREKIFLRLRLMIEPQVKLAQKKFLRSPWKGDLTRLILKELAAQFRKLEVKNYGVTDTGFEIIPIKIHYGLFALKYLNYKYKVEHNKKRDRFLSKLFQ